MSNTGRGSGSDFYWLLREIQPLNSEFFLPKRNYLENTADDVRK